MTAAKQRDTVGGFALYVVAVVAGVIAGIVGTAFREALVALPISSGWTLLPTSTNGHLSVGLCPSVQQRSLSQSRGTSSCGFRNPLAAAFNVSRPKCVGR